MRKGTEVIEEAMRLMEMKDCWFDSTHNIYVEGYHVSVFLTTKGDKSSFRITCSLRFRYGADLENIGYTEYGRYRRVQAIIRFYVHDEHTVVDWRGIEIVVSIDCGSEVCRIILDDHGRGVSETIKSDVAYRISLSIPS